MQLRRSARLLTAAGALAARRPGALLLRLRLRDRPASTRRAPGTNDRTRSRRARRRGRLRAGRLRHLHRVFANNDRRAGTGRVDRAAPATTPRSRSRTSSRSRSRPAAWSTSPTRRRRSPSTGDFEAGDFLSVTFTFGDGETVDDGGPVGQPTATSTPASTTSADAGHARADECDARARESSTRALMTYTLVLLRHGESEWNAKNLFTGWVDVPLNDKGRAEGVRGGELLRDAGVLPDVVHTSLLRRAINTADLGARRRRPALDPGAPLVAPQRAPLRRAAGQEQEGDPRGSTARSSSCSGAAPSTSRRRRSTTTASSPRPGCPQYADLGDELPRTECLKDVIARFLPYWESGDRPRPAGRPDRARRRPRQQPARAGQAPRRDQRRGHRRAQHPHRHAAGLRARRRRCSPTVPGGTLPRPRGRRRGRGRRRQPGSLSVEPAIAADEWSFAAPVTTSSSVAMRPRRPSGVDRASGSRR